MGEKCTGWPVPVPATAQTPNFERPFVTACADVWNTELGGARRLVTMHAMNTIIIGSILVFALIPGPLAAENAARLDVEWEHPAWLNPYRAFVGSARLPADSPANDVVCAYRLAGGDEHTVPCLTTETDPRVLRFSIPAPKKHVNGQLEFRLESRPAQLSGTGRIAWCTDTRTVPVSDEVEVEVSGQTDVELVFPLSDWGARIRFIPCCLILSGWIRAERVPVCPVRDLVGLPERLLSPFYVIDPDDLVKATGGVRIEAAFDIPPDSTIDPVAITAFRLTDGQWTPVLDATTDGAKRLVTFPFADGGTFVLGVREP